MRLRKVEPGLYETLDGRYGIVRVESMDEWDRVESLGWAITDGGAKDGEERPTWYRTMAEARAALAAELAPDTDN